MAMPRRGWAGVPRWSGGMNATVRLTRSSRSTSASIASRNTALSRIPAISEGGIHSRRGVRGFSTGSWTVGAGWTPIARIRSAPRWMAGESGACIRMQPSP